MLSGSIQTYLDELSTQNIPFVCAIDFNTTEAYIWKTTEIPEHVHVSFPSFCNSQKEKEQKIQFDINPINKDSYTNSFARIQKHLQRGNSFLINLTAESEIITQNSLLNFYHASNAKYSMCIENEFVVFSPEPFIKITDNTISTFPMKGTISASLPNAEQQILENKKEIAEHATIVDLLRNDMSTIAEHVEVKKYRYIDTITTNSDTLLQVSSEISGSVKPEFANKIGSILFSMLPAGSICGAPKEKTVSIIKEVETHNRGFYTGIMGYFDGKNFESGVLIRYIEQRDSQLFYKSGGGITTQSNLDDEYTELIHKIYVPTY